MHRYYQDSAAPVVRIRPMVMLLIGFIFIIAFPLVIVWKQAFIASTSMQIESMTDTISAMNRRIAGLETVCGRMSGKERIETFARTVLKLDYPAADRITIIPCDVQPIRKPAEGMNQLLAAVRERPAPREEGE
jgi:hypothetical protein